MSSTWNLSMSTTLICSRHAWRPSGEPVAVHFGRMAPLRVETTVCKADVLRLRFLRSRAPRAGPFCGGDGGT